MQVILTKSAGLRNDLLITIPREELATVRFHIVNRDGFVNERGLLRGPDNQDPAERSKVGALKRPVEDHLRSLGLLDDNHGPTRRILAVGSRNVGNNRGFHAWQHDLSPQSFCIRDDTLPIRALPLLTLDRNGQLWRRDIRVTSQGVLDDAGREVNGEIDWCVFANCVLRDSRIVPIEEIADQFYDIAHLIGIPRESSQGNEIWKELYQGFSLRSREVIVNVLRERRIPRNRFLHNAVGLSTEAVLLLQREGTPEEIAYWLREAGATDGFILDNGGSVFCWAWWIGQSGGYLFQAPDFRPPSSAILAFVLHGSPGTALPPGSVSPSVS